MANKDIEILIEVILNSYDCQGNANLLPKNITEIAERNKVDIWEMSIYDREGKLK